jgi:hypothetical protein
MKAPDWFERRKQPSREEKQARKALRDAEAKVAMAEHEKAGPGVRQKSRASKGGAAGAPQPPKRD